MVRPRALDVLNSARPQPRGILLLFTMELVERPPSAPRSRLSGHRSDDTCSSPSARRLDRKGAVPDRRETIPRASRRPKEQRPSNVTFPFLSVNSIRTVVASGTVTDFSSVAKSPRLMVATCAFAPPPYRHK